MSRCSSWDGYEDSERVSILNGSLTSGDELPSPHGSQTQTHEPESEAEPSPPPAAASPEPSPPPAAASTASSSTSPPFPPEASMYSNCSNAGFYIVWRPEVASGIWIGQGQAAWWTLVQLLPNQKYERGSCRLCTAKSWPEAWKLWWKGGPKQEAPPAIWVV
jgi:hypothetical protein